MCNSRKCFYFVTFPLNIVFRTCSSRLESRLFGMKGKDGASEGKEGWEVVRSTAWARGSRRKPRMDGRSLIGSRRRSRQPREAVESTRWSKTFLKERFIQRDALQRVLHPTGLGYSRQNRPPKNKCCNMIWVNCTGGTPAGRDPSHYTKGKRELNVKGLNCCSLLCSAALHHKIWNIPLNRRNKWRFQCLTASSCEVYAFDSDDLSLSCCQNHISNYGKSAVTSKKIRKFMLKFDFEGCVNPPLFYTVLHLLVRLQLLAAFIGRVWNRSDFNN